MSPPLLEPAETAYLVAASGDGVVDAAVRMRTSDLGSNRWLNKNNRYRDTAVKSLQKDTGARGKFLVENDMAAYVAASAPLHAADGWAYLGRAITSHASGDSDSARHLAYYGELRAAMSILACQGLGIFNDRHVVVRGDGSVGWLRSKRTHEMVWLALELWASLPETAAALAEVFRPANTSIQDWVAAMPGRGSWSAISEGWLRAWGLDLSLFESDRSARNES